MCRNIRPLFNFEPPATEDEIRDASLQFVRKISGFTKPSHANTITVTVDHDAAGGALRIEVSDDGIGGADFTGGTGLLGLKDRAEALGGQIDVHSPSGAGTTVRVQLPVLRANRDHQGRPRP